MAEDPNKASDDDLVETDDPPADDQTTQPMEVQNDAAGDPQTPNLLWDLNTAHEDV
jgi:hypothetical protein